MSWYEASAYAAFAGKSLPVVAQWYMAAPSDVARYIVPASNITTNGAAPVGAYKGVGPFGTYDMAGNVREWVANADDSDHRFILGGSWKSPAYLYYAPEALSPFDRSDANGFRCVKNTAPLPEAPGPRVCCLYSEPMKTNSCFLFRSGFFLLGLGVGAWKTETHEVFRASMAALFAACTGCFGDNFHLESGLGCLGRGRR